MKSHEGPVTEVNGTKWYRNETKTHNPNGLNGPHNSTSWFVKLPDGTKLYKGSEKQLSLMKDRLSFFTLMFPPAR